MTRILLVAALMLGGCAYLPVALSVAQGACMILNAQLPKVCPTCPIDAVPPEAQVCRPPEVSHP